MPYKIQKNDAGRYCVHKMMGGEVGESMGCHDSESGAKEQMAALYAAEPSAKAVAVRMVDGADDLIEGPGIPFGGFLNGQDLYGEHFSKATDFAFDWFPEGRPLLWHHGLDADAGVSPVGRVKSYEVRADIGVWTQAQLDKSSEYFSAIKDLIKQNKLFFSSGAMAHLVEVDKKSGEIRRWPWVELSLTPTPANLLATVDFATASRHYKSAGLELPAAVRAVSRQRMQAMASEMGMEMSEAEMDAMMEGAADMSEDDMRKRLQQKRPAPPKAISFSDMVSLILDDPGLDYEPVPIGFHAETVTHLAASLLERTKGLQQRRLKEGRVISDANRKRLMACMEQMGAAMQEMQSLMDSSAPQSAKAAALRRLRAQMVALQVGAMATAN